MIYIIFCGMLCFLFVMFYWLVGWKSYGVAVSLNDDIVLIGIGYLQTLYFLLYIYEYGS